jgi:very-short-patch-repair endonuclease
MLIRLYYLDMQYPQNDTLVAAFKNKEDFLYARDQGWYRIPVNSPMTSMIESGRIKYISFYFKNLFGPWKYSIRHVARVSNLIKIKRHAFFPNEPLNPKSESIYYQINFGPLHDLPQPILCFRGRRILFIPTTLHKLQNATEINDIFADSPLEDLLWAELKRNNLPAERQFYLQTNTENWICDFAIFCKKGNINVECDGDEYHMKPEQVIYDKHRNNQISAVANWSPLRFTTRHLLNEIPQTIQTIKRKIDKLEGIEVITEDKITYRYVLKQDGQLNLFD